MNKAFDINKFTLLTPKEIVEQLDQYVIGQEETKKTLALAVYNHYKRIKNVGIGKCLNSVELDKSNLIILGDTGTGKTFMIQQIAKMLNVGLYIGNANNYTAAGYVGKDVESCLTGLIQACNGNIGMAEISIVCIDEIDKIAKKSENVSITRDVSGECVQQALLKMVEGDVVGVSNNQGRIHPEQSLININTKNILFICMGTFVGIDQIVKRRIGRNHIGFGSSNTDGVNSDDILKYVTSDDLVKFGLIPEFIGRFPIVAHTKKLSEKDLVRILKEPKNAILKQHEQLLLLDNTILTFTEDSLTEIAKVALRLGTGARGLRRIVEMVLEDIMFNAPTENKKQKKPVKIKIDKAYVIERTKNILLTSKVA